MTTYSENIETLIESLLETFLEVADNIHSLGKCSATDFNFFSQYFKDCHSNIQKIIDSLDVAFDIYPKKERDLFASEIQQTISNTENFYKSAHYLLSRLQGIAISNYNKNNILDIYWNNLKQDIGSLKFLLVNIALSTRFIKNTENKELFQQVSLEIDNFISALEPDVLALNTTSTEIFELIDSQLYTSLLSKSKKEIIVENVYEVFDKIIRRLDRENKSFVEQTKTINDSFSKIITNLQYEDILRQKIEHIHFAHEEAKKEIEQVKKVKNEDLKTENNEKLLRSIFVVNKIIELQTAQLININKEYQKAIRHIVEKFQLLDSSTHALAELGEKFLTKTSMSGTFYKDLHNSIKIDISIYDQVPECFLLIEKVTSLKKKQLQQLQTIATKLNAFAVSFYQNIVTLTAGQPKENVHNIDLIFTNIIHNSEALIRIVDEFMAELNSAVTSLPQNLDRTKNLYKTYQNQTRLFIENIENKDKVLMENILHSHDRYSKTSKEINQLLKKVTFYGCFEKTTREIETRFTEITNFIATSLLKGKEHTIDESTIKKLKDVYTMDSERSVHNKILTDNLLDISDESDESDLELF